MVAGAVPGVEPGAVSGPDRGGGPTTAARVENVLARAAVFFRLAGLFQIGVAVAFATARYPHPLATFGLIAVVAAESGVWSAATLRARRTLPGWTVADTVFMAVTVAIGAVLTAPEDLHTWVHFMYPFSLIAVIAIGLTYPGVRVVGTLATLVAVSYVVSAIVAHHDPFWNTAPNALSYFANPFVAWAIARHLRGSGREADESRAGAVAQADELARERERARHARMLHDRVLQTLETLANSDWLPDPGVRAHLGTEAAWLRALVEGSPWDQPSDLLSALQNVVQARIRTGLRIEFNSTRLRDAGPLRAALPAEAVEALADATGEALTNVAKHSGVDAATVRAEVAGDEVVVSVLDQGCGFDPATSRRGIGLTRSILERMAGVSGAARIDSAPGAGTYVELRVRLVGDGAEAGGVRRD